MPNKLLLFCKKITRDPITAAAVRRFGMLSGLFFYSELVFQTLTGTFGIGFIRAGFFILTGTALLTFISLCFPKIVAFLLSEVVVLLVSIMSVAQLLYIKIFHEFLSIDMMGAGGEAIVRFWDILSDAIRVNIFGIILLLLPVFVLPGLYIFRRLPAASRLHDFFNPFPEASRLHIKYAVIPVLVLCALRYSLLIPVAVDSFSPLAVRFGQDDTSKISSVSEVGLYTTMEIDLMSQFFSSGVSSVLDELPELSAISVPSLEAFAPSASSASSTAQDADSLDGSDTGDADGDDSEMPDLPPEPPPWEGKTNSFDIDFEALIERDVGSRGLTQLHEYFSSLEPSAQNEMTGLFEGYNLITICAEAFTGWAIDPELTPTLYMMQHDGVYFENFYSIYGSGTIGGEFALVTGIMPRGSGGWCTNAARNYLPFTFASRFIELGVQPLAYHNGSYTFYDRNIMFPRLGYDFTAYGGGLDMSVYGYSTSDHVLMKITVDDWIDQDRFHVHYMTFSGHANYNFGNPQARVNRDAVEHLPYSNEVKAYFATQLEFEYAMAYLMERLEEAGIAERTVIVITSDHYPYGMSHAKVEELAGKSLDRVSQLYESAGIIYVKGMEPVTVTTPAFPPDMTPTVLNLLGMPFDSRFLPGRDVFSDAMPFVILGSSIITEAGVHTRGNRGFTPFEGVGEVPDEYISAVIAIDAARRSAIEQIVSLDYFESIREFLE